MQDTYDYEPSTIYLEEYRAALMSECERNAVASMPLTNEERK